MAQSTAARSLLPRSSWLAWILCAIICAAAPINISLVDRNGPAGNQLAQLISDSGWGILQVVFAVVGALIVSHQLRNIIGWLLMIPALALALGQPAGLYLGRFTSAPSPTAAVLVLTWFTSWSWLPVVLPLPLMLLLFPTGSPPSPRWRWVLFYALGLAVFFLFVATFVAPFSEQSGNWTVPNPIGVIPDRPWVEDFIIPIWIMNLAALTLICAASLFVRYRRAATVERLQIKWLLFAGGVFVALYVPMLLLPSTSADFESLFSDIILFLLGALFPIAIAMAILRYRLFDIDVIINRALVYGALTALVISFYVLVVGYLGSLLKAENNLFISLAATGLVAVLFQPLRDRLQLGVNHMMYGQRDEPVTVLSRLGARLEAALPPDEILPGLVDNVKQALKLPYAAIALKVADDFQIQAEGGHTFGTPEAFPLIHHGEIIGQLLVGRRSPAEEFNPADRLLLTNIARQAGTVAHAVQLNTALQQSRQQLVTAREEERRRLRRDLHDGLGPQLASQTLTIDAIGKLLQQNPVEARDLLGHLKAQSQAAIQDIRRLVYGLRPPALDELGLVQALREGVRLDGQAGTTVEITTVPAVLPALPAAVEVAVYRITQEALTNMIRHAQARRCTVSIVATGGQLDLTITDDGIGYADGFHFGVGLNAMRERAEELGGTIRFENRPKGGALVQVWLPLPGDGE